MNAVLSKSTSLGLETIGPKEAAKILAHVHPRQLGRDYKSVIELYARQMELGQWDIGVAQTIAISDRGELVDGWHRMHAVIRANRTLRFYVVRGVPSDSFGKYDAGKSRSLAFRCGLDKETAAVVNLMLQLSTWERDGRSYSTEEVGTALDFIRPQLNLFNKIVTTTRKRKIGNAPVKLACLLRMMENPTIADELAHHFKTLQGGDLAKVPLVISLLYRRLLERKNSAVETFALSWMAFDPERAHNAKLPLYDLSGTVREVRETVLRTFIETIA